jgi:type II secretory pathway pseudopilin PulG
LIEIVIAMALLAVLLVSALPMFLSMVRGTVVTRLQTQAKNLAQERLEQVRDLRYHVDRQNGPFLDLLDIYYTNANASSPTTTVLVGGDTLTGSYVPTGGGTGGEPAAPYYRVQTSDLAGTPGFSQVVTAQFLEGDGKTPVPVARFQGTASSGYDSQVAGRDTPPTLMLGITVITRWMQDGVQKTFRTYTTVTETRPERPVLQSQARATAVDISSTAADGTTLQLQGGVASLDGAQSSGSSVAGYVTGALARRTGQAVQEGRNARFQLPDQPVALLGTGSAVVPTGCTWFGFGGTAVDNVTADVSTGLPKAPANVDDTTPKKVLSGRIVDNAGNACGALSFTTVVDAGVQRTDAVGIRMGPSPLAYLPDSGGSGTSVQADAYVTATDLIATPQRAYSGARMNMGRAVRLFPNSPDNPKATAIDYGLLTARVTNASIDCTSGTSATVGTVSASYTAVLRWWGRSSTETAARWHQATWNYDTTTGTTPLLAAGSDTWNPSSVFLSDGQPLGNIVSVELPKPVTEGGATGLRGFSNGILSMASVGTLTTEVQPGSSAVQVKLGQLTCVADDQR